MKTNLTTDDFMNARDTLAELGFVYLKNLEQGNQEKPEKPQNATKLFEVVKCFNDLSDFKAIMRLENQRHEYNIISDAKTAIQPIEKPKNGDIKSWHYAAASLGLLAFGAGWLWLVVKVIGALF